MTSPLVSVVIPHYNRTERLLATLDSVKAQSLTDWEAIVVDDASDPDPTERLQAAFADPRIRFLRLERNAGPSNARNVGLREAKGRYVAFLDSDDYWEPRKLEAQVEAMVSETDQERVICTAQVQVVGPGEQRQLSPMRPVAEGESFAEYCLIQRQIIQTSSVLLTRKAALQIAFDPSLRQYEDFLFFIRAGHLNMTHRLVMQPLLIWFNDERPDRLSNWAHPKMGDVAAFLTAAGDMIDARIRLYVLTKIAGVAYVRETPFKALPDVLRAMGSGLISFRAAGGLIRRAILAIFRTKASRAHSEGPSGPPGQG